MLIEKLSLQLTGDEELVSIDTTSMITTLDRAPTSEAALDIRVSAVGKARLKKAAESLNPEHFTGKTNGDLQAIAEKKVGIELIEVRIRPFWEKNTPQRIERIHFVIK